MKPLQVFPRRLAVAVVAPSLFCCLAMSAGATTYSFQTLDNQTDPTFNQLLGINNSGTIAGYYGVGTATNPNKGYTLAPPYGQANYTSENFPSSAQTQVVGINSNASPTTVGFWVDNAGNNFGFVKQGTNFTSVSDPNTPAGGPLFNQLMGVNAENVAVGVYTGTSGNLQAYTYNVAKNKFTAITLPPSFGAIETTATGINNAGDISGFYVDGADVTHGFLDIGGTFSRFDDPNGIFVNTSFLGLNNKGEVVGSYVDANLVTEGLTYNYLTNTWATVNDPLSSGIIAQGVSGTTVNGVNDLGQLVGFYSDGTNVNGFLATPVPEPTAAGLIGLGLLACVSMRKWRRGRA
ncbi:MAG: PEP-CTERM sorting domain-containing protein [Acidobacteriaceae bacterium]|nr:PEP-CTERM sorting domain-containing protein [Acidobacteriaceae bacterium]